MLVTSEAVLRRFWYALAFVEDLADGPLARRLLGTDLVIWSSGPGHVGAALDRCPHRDARLSAGWMNGPCVVCPYHGWEYGPDGAATVIPQMEPGLPLPPKARLATVRAEVAYGVVWVALEEPLRPIPELPMASDPRTRTIRQFDEVWQASAPRLIDNSFDPAHTAFVHRKTFGGDPRVQTPTVERTEFGLIMRTEVEVKQVDGLEHITGDAAPTTVRSVETTWWAPFFRVLDQTYPSGVRHTIAMSATPVDDTHLRLVQWVMRNDSEAEVPAADVVEFDRRVTWEDRALLEQVWPDYSLELTDNVHVKVDRPTVVIRQVLAEICAGAWG
jgi:phenylpropionate dioxygenase-like ring-hydroxylating dioxygenase large terminal subunit